MKIYILICQHNRGTSWVSDIFTTEKDAKTELDDKLGEYDDRQYEIEVWDVKKTGSKIIESFEIF